MVQPPSAEDAVHTDSVEIAYRWIRDRILTGEMEPGSTLSQVQLARELRISRTPLREALRQLAAEGLVISDFNRRIRISELDLRDFDEIYAMRFALEPIGVRATVPALSESHREQLIRSVELMGKAVEAEDLPAFRTSHREFHLGLIRGAGPRFERTLGNLWDHSERYRLSYMHVGRADDREVLSGERFRIGQEEHHGILAAALAGEVDSCSEQLIAHLQRTFDGVFREASRISQPTLSRAVADSMTRGSLVV